MFKEVHTDDEFRVGCFIFIAVALIIGIPLLLDHFFIYSPSSFNISYTSKSFENGLMEVTGRKQKKYEQPNSIDSPDAKYIYDYCCEDYFKTDFSGKKSDASLTTSALFFWDNISVAQNGNISAKLSCHVELVTLLDKIKNNGQFAETLFLGTDRSCKSEETAQCTFTVDKDGKTLSVGDGMPGDFFPLFPVHFPGRKIHVGDEWEYTCEKTMTFLPSPLYTNTDYFLDERTQQPYETIRIHYKVKAKLVKYDGRGSAVVEEQISMSGPPEIIEPRMFTSPSDYVYNFSGVGSYEYDCFSGVILKFKRMLSLDIEADYFSIIRNTRTSVFLKK